MNKKIASTETMTLIAFGSARQSADVQARLLRQTPGLARFHIVAVARPTAGFLRVLATPADRWMATEVADVYGRPVRATWLLRPCGTAVLDAATLVTAHPYGADDNVRNVATSYGVGQLITVARYVGSHHVVVAAAGFPGGDCGSGAAHAAGARLKKLDGSGVKVGVNELGGFARLDTQQLVAPPRLTVLCDTRAPLKDSMGPNDARQTFIDAIENANPDVTCDTPRGGAYDGMAFGLAGLLHAELVDANAYAVALHDPDAMARQQQVLIGGQDELEQMASHYPPGATQIIADQIDETARETVRSRIGL